MCKALNAELVNGKALAAALVEHLYVMGAGKCIIPVQRDGIAFLVTVEPEAKSLAERNKYETAALVAPLTLPPHIEQEVAHGLGGDSGRPGDYSADLSLRSVAGHTSGQR